MNDLIERQAAISEVKALYEWHDTVTEDRAIDHLMRLPSANPEQQSERWIPCTEGLPGVYIDVIVSSKRGVQVMHMTPGGYWTDGAQLDAPGYVEAWMPMPEPWKGAE